MSIKPDRELVEAVVAGECEVFAELVARYSWSVMAIATEIVDDKHVAEDVAQDAFVLAYEGLNSLRNGDVFGAWLCQITRRHAYQVVRKERRMQQLQKVPHDSLTGKADSNDKLADDSRELLSLVERLPKHERVVVLLKYFDSHSLTEIACMTDQAVGTVTKKLTRARKRLQIWLERNDR